MDESVLEILDDFANALESAAVSLKRRVAEATSTSKAPIVEEETFEVLTFEKRTGDRIGNYEVALKSANQEVKWDQAFNILTAHHASINDRYHPKGYVYCYWLYGQGKIYRQKLKQV
jgi:hypothetical protein